MNIFTYTKYPISGGKLLYPLITIRGHQCECCGNKTWLNEPIALQVHHKDGNRLNNTLDNLQLLCPNCHAKTENFNRNHKNSHIEDESLIQILLESETIHQALITAGLSTAGTNYDRVRKLLIQYDIHKFDKKEKELNYCVDCGALISFGSTRCVECDAKYKKTEKPVSREELKALIRTTPFTTIGQRFNVSDNAIRKWCDGYKLPRTKKEINNYSEEEWQAL